jgi:hypothetical protein
VFLVIAVLLTGGIGRFMRGRTRRAVRFCL